MGWAFKIGEFRGIGVYLHVTFLLLLAVVGGWTLLSGGGVALAAESVLFLMVLFGCVVLHEFGHALTAQRYGIPTRDITLLPIGGVARLERMPDDPWQELWVALAGPAVNVVIAAVLFAGLVLTGTWTPLAEFSMVDGFFLQQILFVNITLVIFNLLPAFPMDGGRVLRAFLAMRTDYARATQIAAWAGQGMAVLFGIVGLFGNPMLLFIAMFVWMGAGQEAKAARMRATFEGVPVSNFMSRQFQAISPDDTLEWATRVLMSSAERELPVVHNGELLGFLDRRSLFQALATRHPATHVSSVMRPVVATVRSDDSLAGAFERMQQSQATTAPVMDGSYLVGLIHLDKLMDVARGWPRSRAGWFNRRESFPSAL